jgi:hypothetical protein
MNDEIKEKLAIHRVIFAAAIFSLIGLVSWSYQIFINFGLHKYSLISCILTIFYTITIVTYYKKLQTLIKKNK